MVRQLFLPSEGGGSLRRFLAIRKHLFRDKWQDDRPIRGPITLFDLRRPDDVADLRESLLPAEKRRRGIFSGWRVSDDSVIGGFSSSLMEFNEGCETKGDNKTIAPPFLRWSGKISTEINRHSHLARNITRSGFAAIFTPEFPLGAPLGNKYRALEICCRTDGRTYAVNLKVESYFPEDMYQGFISGSGINNTVTVNKTNVDGNTKADDTQTLVDDDDQEQEEEQPILDVREHLKSRQQIISSQDPNNHPYQGHPPAGFQRLILPFKDFALTSRGRMRYTQRDLDGAVNIESIGFTLMDGKDGDFCFDLVSLRAVNMMGGEVVGTREEDAREEELVTQYNEHTKKED